jgi:activator of HSP90 ATPase
MRHPLLVPAASRAPFDGDPAATLTRRQSLGALALLAAAATLAPQALLAAADPATPAAAAAADANGTLTSLRQEIALNAPPARVYEVLLSAKDFSAFTGMAAHVEPVAGRAFSLFGGLITGRNVELVPAQRIVQAWRSSGWDPGVYSVARFALTSRAAGTSLVLDHTGFPQGTHDHLDSGWYSHYWEPLKKLFG